MLFIILLLNCPLLLIWLLFFLFFLILDLSIATFLSLGMENEGRC